MTRVEIGTVAVVLIAIVGGGVAFGQLEGRMSSLEALKPHEKAEELVRKGEGILGEMNTRMADIENLQQAFPVIEIKASSEDIVVKEGKEEKDRIIKRADICYLTRVGMKSEGTGTFVEVYFRDGAWYLGGQHRNAPENELVASATCIEFKMKN